jgi:hypothetical protein
MAGTTETQPMRERLASVLERIDKELARVEHPHANAGTAYVGGIAKLGAALDQYLLEVWRWLCVRLSMDPVSTARGASPSIVLDRAGAGQLLLLLSRYSAHSVAVELPVRVVLAQARHHSPLDAVISLRNAIIHGRETADVGTIRGALSQLRDALSPQLALLETA